MINLSIVTGTYNRMTYLRKMVNSVRTSIGRGLGYEIVVVDGGSTDGSIAWCKSQPDIRLIEQGTLLGAVKAFNAGAYASRGKYVVLANDDVTFINESLQRAYAFMEDNLSVGIGCFFQDRYGRPMYVDRMSAVSESGARISCYYGQVCIVPKWLGDNVGWWGDYLRTYGGDNELSCNIIELGYAVEPIPCACIHDAMCNDGLRELNNPTTRTTHADSLAFRTKWPNGPTFHPLKLRENLGKRARVLYAPIYAPGDAMQHKTKYGLLKALRKVYDVTEIDYLEQIWRAEDGLSGVDNLYYTADAFQPDIFLLQLHDSKHIPLEVLQRLRAEHTGSLFISWNGDYSMRNFNDPMYHKCLSLMDIATFCTADIFPMLRDKGIKCGYWQIGYEEYVEQTLRPADRRYSVIFQGNEYSEGRTYLGHILRAIPDSGIFGRWQSIRADGETNSNFAAQDKLYRSSRICISDQQFPKSVGYVSNRLFQAMRSGVFVLQQRINEMERYLGMKDGVHLVVWDDIRELPELINYWLLHDQERSEIAQAGKDLVMHEHNFDRRVREFTGFVSEAISARV